MENLAKKNGSVTSEFMNIMEQAFNIQSDSNLSDSEKKEELLLLSIQALNNATSVSDEYYSRKRTQLMSCKTDAQIIKVLTDTIYNGTNYEKEGNKND